MGIASLYLYSEIKDDYLRERGSDIEDVMRRLLVALSGVQSQNRDLSEDAVVVSRDLLPSAVAELDLDHTRALATDSWQVGLRTAILARGVGIPAVVGLRDFYRRTKTGDRIIVDSTRNLVNPSSFTRNPRSVIRPRPPLETASQEQLVAQRLVQCALGTAWSNPARQRRSAFRI